MFEIADKEIIRARAFYERNYNYWFNCNNAAHVETLLL